MLRWVRQILIRKLTNAWRYYGRTAKRDIHREQALPERDGPSRESHILDQNPTPETQLIACERAQMVAQIMERLPSHYQQLIRLRSFERRSFQEIGEALHTSTEAARKAWGRAIERFRREWNEVHREG
jgi:RNA polymerase sigma-70 factor (ECF subfamily)